jgi:hypothetical protein
MPRAIASATGPDRMIDTPRAFGVGVAGGVVMTASMAIFRAFGVPADLEMMLGTLTGAQPGKGPWIAGFFLHLLISGIIGILYAIGFQYVLRAASWRAGLLVAVVHGIVAGFVMAIVPAIHPLIPERMPAPGAFMANLGAGGIADFWMARFVYGATVGALYGRTAKTNR